MKLLFICILSSLVQIASAQDFSPWKELVSFRPNAEIQTAVHKLGSTATVHRIEDGSGDVNLDYYPVRISVFPTIDGKEVSPSEFLEFVRLHLNDFLDNKMATFAPFRESDKIVWESNSCEGAVVLIDIKLTSQITDLALVVVSQCSKHEWRFSTVRGGSGYAALNDRSNPGAHPVSGNRAFGLAKVDGVWTFYTIGADRATRPMDEFWGFSGASEIGFKHADGMWQGFQRQIAEFVVGHGGKAEVDVSKTRSKRYEWNVLKDQKIFDSAGQPDWIPTPIPN